MEMFKVIILAIVQGISELLPISSSAHLILVGKVIDLPTDTYLLAILHLGTTLAIIIYFLPTLLKDIFKKESISFYTKIALATIPAAITGLFLESFIENTLRADIYIIISLILWGIVMILVEQRYKPKEEIDLKKISLKQSLIMGFSQILSLIPGTSRSAVTTVAGVLSGVNKYSALQYSFILGIPILLGMSIYEMIKYIPQQGFTITHLTGIIISALVGYLVLILLKKNKKTNWLTIFGYYRILLGILISLSILL